MSEVPLYSAPDSVREHAFRRGVELGAGYKLAGKID